LEAGFSVGIPPCPSGRKTGGSYKGKLKEVKEVKEVKQKSKTGVWTRVDRQMSPMSLTPPTEACGPKRNNNKLSAEVSERE